MQPPSPTRRGPRRKRPVTFRLHATVVGTEPPLYRLLAVSSELFLNDLNEVLGASFGWVNRASHEFRCGAAVDDPTADRYICPEAVADRDPAVPEEQVRLDELLNDLGDTLYYIYDFADPWVHHIYVEEILPRTTKMPRARCMGGQRDCPADVAGGIARYEYLSRRADWDDEGESFQYVRPEDIITESESEYAEPSPFVIEEINWALANTFGYGREQKSVGP
ncbi:plasmid pRiA4b ORF-3 family protein [Nocardia sp. NBC_01327]|uniref:plasmid pRiA4b ORF-3 family protein n=1 Tax=Nocardia sp. NBC_01327 TaxID=2903593 RepID=UPI002E149B77|nr:plasmid pRiA4b ORF-3 family protein [Nocardia sp. NBC_01327]